MLEIQSDAKINSIRDELSSIKSSLEYYKVDNMQMKRRLADLEEKASLQDIKSKRFNITIEGFLEVKDEETKDVVIEKCNADADKGLNDADIVSAKRVGKISRHRKNRPIFVTVRDEAARDKILQSRGKLRIEIVRTPVWMNEDIPATYRRRKAMLRDLVKLVQSFTSTLPLL